MPRIRVGLVFAAFPALDRTPYNYFLLLLNRLQRTCQFEIFDMAENDEFVGLLSTRIVDADAARGGLDGFGSRIREQIGRSIAQFDLAVEEPDLIIVITGATLSDLHYLIRRRRTTLLALGRWERGMSPPSLAEFLQVLVLRAAYSALEGSVWESIHLGNRACIFDFTENLDHTRLMALAGVGVCQSCEGALLRDGFLDSPGEIRNVVSREWRGDRDTPGTPANIMARLKYDLFLTKGFESTTLDRLRRIVADDGAREAIRLAFALALAWLVLTLRLKT